MKKILFFLFLEKKSINFIIYNNKTMYYLCSHNLETSVFQGPRNSPAVIAAQTSRHDRLTEFQILKEKIIQRRRPQTLLDQHSTTDKTCPAFIHTIWSKVSSRFLFCTGDLKERCILLYCILVHVTSFFLKSLDWSQLMFNILIIQNVNTLNAILNHSTFPQDGQVISLIQDS